MLIYEMLDRKLEKTNINAFLIYIRYDGMKFDCFDENKGLKSVKGYFKELFKKHDIMLYKGIQQAGRTDKLVSANENILYIQTKKNDIKMLLNDDMVLRIRRTIPFLEFPDLIEKREYIFSYPKNLIKNKEESILRLCQKYSKTMDFSEFTTNKGKLLKNLTRTLKISFIDGKLIFLGDSFLPHQVRKMSSYILTGSKKELSGEYLTLNKIYLKKELEDVIFEKVNFEFEGVESAYVSKKYTLIYTKDISKMIGKNGKNIKKMKIENKVIIKKSD